MSTPEFPGDQLPPPRPRRPFLEPVTIFVVVGIIALGAVLWAWFASGPKTYRVDASGVEFNERLQSNLRPLDPGQMAAPRPGSQFSSLLAPTKLVSEIYPDLGPADYVADLRHADCLWIADTENVKASWELIAAGLRRFEDDEPGDLCIVDRIGACTYSHPETREPLRCEADDEGQYQQRQSWADSWLGGNRGKFKVVQCALTAGSDNYCEHAELNDDCEEIPVDTFCQSVRPTENQPFCMLGCTFQPEEDATLYLDVPVIVSNIGLFRRRLTPSLKVVGSSSNSDDNGAASLTRPMELHVGNRSDPNIGGTPLEPGEVEYRWRVPELAQGRLAENFSNTLRIVRIRFLADNGGSRRELRGLRLGVRNIEAEGARPEEICNNSNGPLGYNLENCAQLETYVPTYQRGCLGQDENCGLLRWHSAFLKREGENAENPEALGEDEVPLVEFTLMTHNRNALTALPTQAMAILDPGVFNFALPENGGPPAIGDTRQVTIDLRVSGPGQTDLLEVGVDGSKASDFSVAIQGASIGAPLPGSNSYPITVTYTPTASPPTRGSFTRLARLFIRLRQGGRVREVSARLVSYIAERELQVLENEQTVDQLQFAYSLFGRTQTLSLTLRNRRPADNVVTSMAIEGVDSGLFRLWNTQTDQSLSVGSNGVLLTANGGRYNFGLRFHQPGLVRQGIDATLVVHAFTGELRIPLSIIPPGVFRRWVAEAFDTEPEVEWAISGGN